MIAAVSRALAQILFDDGLGAVHSVGLRASTEVGGRTLVLCPYAFGESVARTMPVAQRPGTAPAGRWHLGYLIAPQVADPLDAQEHLWRAALALRASPVLEVPGGRATVRFLDPSAEERGAAWAVVELTPRLALFCDVEFVAGA